MRCKIRPRVPHGIYWSVSAFDAGTNNFFVRSDRQETSDEVRLVLLPPHEDPTRVGNNTLHIRSLSMRGVVLFRTLINVEANLAEIDRERRQARCDTWMPSQRVN